MRLFLLSAFDVHFIPPRAAYCDYEMKQDMSHYHCFNSSLLFQAYDARKFHLNYRLSPPKVNRKIDKFTDILLFFSILSPPFCHRPVKLPQIVKNSAVWNDILIVYSKPLIYPYWCIALRSP